MDRRCTKWTNPATDRFVKWGITIQETSGLLFALETHTRMLKITTHCCNYFVSPLLLTHPPVILRLQKVVIFQLHITLVLKIVGMDILGKTIIRTNNFCWLISGCKDIHCTYHISNRVIFLVYLVIWQQLDASQSLAWNYTKQQNLKQLTWVILDVCALTHTHARTIDPRARPCG